MRFGGAVASLALVVYTLGIFDTPFVDEYAYITQSFYSDLFFRGKVDDPAWIYDFAFDLQPLPKYVIGNAMHAAHLKMPGPRDAARWYKDSHTRFGPPETLTAARIPFIVVAALGCLAIFAFGVLAGGRLAGTVAALLLVMNPLFRLHAHRTMSEAPCEAFLIAALFFGLLAWRRAWSGKRSWMSLIPFALAGICSGLSILSKFNGLLAPIIIGCWCGLGVLTPGLSAGRKLVLAAGVGMTFSMAVVTFVPLNPALTAHPNGPIPRAFAARARLGPWGRFVDMVEYRLESAAGQKLISKFQRDVLGSPVDKAGVFAVQGFGRFGPFGPSKSNSEVRYQLGQDWGLAFWWPLVLVGIYQTFQLGRQQSREGAPPSGFALLIWALVSWSVVAVYIPLAWDRYLLPIQAPNALLVAVAVSRLWPRWRERAVRA